MEVSKSNGYIRHLVYTIYMPAENLNQQIEALQELKKQNPDVDVDALMLSALHQHSTLTEKPKSYKWAYLISLGVPPFGFFFAIKFFMSGEQKDRDAAFVCLILTGISIILFVSIAKMFAGSGVSSINQLTPADVQNLTQ